MQSSKEEWYDLTIFLYSTTLPIFLYYYHIMIK